MGALSLLAFLVASSQAAPSRPPSPPAASRLSQVVADYVGLYRAETLPRWRELFLPSFTVASTNPDGSVRQRNLDEFYGAQERYLKSGREISEELSNLQIEECGRLASVWADFVLSDAGDTSRGKLVLLLIEDRGAWRIQSLMFSYDEIR